LKETELDPQYLELEITESMTMSIQVATNTIRELKDLGVRIAIDDFGTGYSSLNYFKKLPIDRLKIDQSFVRDITKEYSKDKDIVATIIAMGHNLRLRVIAEGVEMNEQFQFLKEYGCDDAQGYLVEPISTEEFKHRYEPNILK
jgi:EAL domain-containing protein (putative c-di-GMP-specific phosphodiesterase class I)